MVGPSGPVLCRENRERPSVFEELDPTPEAAL
jgi:hypothetical protein